jgi:hypothetical protein
MRVILQRHCTHEVTSHKKLLTIHADLDKEAPALIGTVVEVDAAVLVPALGQVGAVLEHPVQLHDWGEEAECVESH